MFSTAPHYGPNNVRERSVSVLIPQAGKASGMLQPRICEKTDSPLPTTGKARKLILRKTLGQAALYSKDVCFQARERSTHRAECFATVFSDGAYSMRAVPPVAVKSSHSLVGGSLLSQPGRDVVRFGGSRWLALALLLVRFLAMSVYKRGGFRSLTLNLERFRAN